MVQKLSVLMIGPQPPSIGGIASYVRDLKHIIETQYNIKIISIIPYIVEENKIKELVLKIFSIWVNLFRIINSAIEDKFDIVHIHTSSKFSFLENSIFLLILKVIFKKPVILHIHAPDFDVFMQKVDKFKKYYIKSISFGFVGL